MQSKLLLRSVEFSICSSRGKIKCTHTHTQIGAWFAQIGFPCGCCCCWFWIKLLALLCVSFVRWPSAAAGEFARAVGNIHFMWLGFGRFECVWVQFWLWVCAGVVAPHNAATKKIFVDSEHISMWIAHARTLHTALSIRAERRVDRRHLLLPSIRLCACRQL